MADRAAPAAMAAVVGDQPIAQRLVGGRLQFPIEAGAHRQPGLVEPLFAVPGVELAAHFFGEIGAGDDLGVLAAAQHDRLCLGGGDLGLGRGTVFGDALEHPIAPDLGLLGIARRVVVVRRLWQSGQEGRLAEAQFVERFVEIKEGGRLYPIGAGAEIDLVEVELEDPVLRQRLVDPGSEQDLLDLAVDRQLVRQQHVLGDLLRDGRGADRPALAVPAPDIGQRGAEHRDRVDAVVAVEILVLGRQEGGDDALGDRRDRHEHPPLGGIFGQQPPIAGMDARQNRRLVMRQLLVIGQIAPEIPDRQPDDAATGDRQQHDADE